MNFIAERRLPRLIVFIIVFAMLLFCNVSFSVEQQSCKILDHDLAQGVYSGGCKDGLAHGYGTVSGMSSYRGDFYAGKKHGKGDKTMPNGDRYVGDFRDDYRHGKGVYIWGSKTPWAGDRYEGEYQRDLRHGLGAYKWSNGDRYEGLWKDDLRLGLSVMEKRRAEAAAAAEKGVKVGAKLCADEKWDLLIRQRLLGKIESIIGDAVRVRILEVEGGYFKYQGKILTAGDEFVDEALHWQACEQN